jgi:putative ABC transport system permease protein
MDPGRFTQGRGNEEVLPQGHRGPLRSPRGVLQAGAALRQSPAHTLADVRAVQPAGAEKPSRAETGASASWTAALLGRALRSRPVRTALVVAGISASALLVLVLFAVYRSLTSNVLAYVGQEGIDLWLAPVGTDNLIRSSGLLPGELLERLRLVPGVGRADPLLRAFVTVEPRRDPPQPRLTLLAVGYEAPDGLGGPPLLAAGVLPAGRKQALLDRAAAYRLGVGVGDTLRVNGRPARVVGLTRGTNLLATQFLFAGREALEQAGGMEGRMSLVAVRLEPDASAVEVARKIESRFLEVAVYPREAFAANNLREVAAGFLPVLALVAALGAAVTSVLVALLVHAVMEERRAEIAVLLALGAGSAALGSAMLRRAVGLVAAGCAAGAAMAWALAALLDRAFPVLELTIQPADLAIAAGLFGMASMLAVAAPILELRRMDPLEAFRP